MIIGAINWNYRTIRYNQEKRVIEKFLADIKITKQATYWLESCNVCACACAVEAIGAKWRCSLPMIDNKPIISQADLLFDYIYSDVYGKYKKDGVCENEVPEHLTAAIEALSESKAELKTFFTTTDTVESMKAQLKKGHACVFSYLTDYQSGHYIVAVAYDDEVDSFICYDSWSSNKHCKNYGVQELYTSQFLKQRLRMRFIDVYK